MKKLVLVETISMFRIRYAVECDSVADAEESVILSECESELSQLHLDELITSAREISQEEFLEIFDADNDYLRDWNTTSKLAYINKL